MINFLQLLSKNVNTTAVFRRIVISIPFSNCTNAYMISCMRNLVYMIRKHDLSINMTSIMSLLIIAVSILIFLSAPAFSQAVNVGELAACDYTTLGGMFCAFQESSLAKLITFVMGFSFLAGLFLFYKGILKLLKVGEASGGSSETLSSALLTLAGGSFLVAFPTTIMVGLATFGVNNAWDYNSNQQPGAAGAVTGDSFTVLIANFAVNAAGPLSSLVMGVAVLIGLVLIASSILNLSSMNSPQSRTPEFSGIIGKFIVGIALVNIFWVMGIIGTSFGLPSNGDGFFTGITSTSMSYVKSISGDSIEIKKRMDTIMLLVFSALIPFGLIAFVRGLLIIKDTTDGTKQASLGSGFTHIVGGVALVNAKSVGCSVISTLTGAPSFCILS
jgi:hypothetical protein